MSDQMNMLGIQRYLKSVGYYTGKLDGDAGRQTWQAVLDLLEVRRNELTNRPREWGRARRLVAVQQLFCKDKGYDPGPVDGYWGPSTAEAMDMALGKVDAGWRDKIKEPSAAEKAALTRRVGTTWPRQRDMIKFYGQPGQNQAIIQLPTSMRIAWNLRQKATRISCHEKVADPMLRIITNTIDHYGEDQWRKLGLDLYGGCLNVRKMRGGSAWSMHSWGIAMDIDPANNRLRWNKSKARLARPEYEPFWKIVEGEGAISLGRIRDFDWMHFQFARL